MSYIVKEDYTSHIRENRLDQVTNYTDNNLTDAQARAMGFVKSHISGRFDTAAIFAATGSDRDPVILGFTIDIALYYLWRAVAPRKIPTHVKEAYDEAVLWLEGVKEGTIIPEGLPANTNDSATTVRWGSNPKRESHI